MKKQNENFIEKFRLLDSQETCEEISWSCSESSDYEDNISSGKFVMKTYGKRKRGHRKRKELRNISNLDITTVDSLNERTSCVISAKSPILVGKSRSLTSPILTPSQLYLPRFITIKAAHNSPATHYHTDIYEEPRNTLQSPIFKFRRETPKESPSVKKKLFETGQSSHNSSINKPQSLRSTSPIIGSETDCLDKRKNTIEHIFENTNLPDSFRIIERTKDSNLEQTIPISNNVNKKMKINQPDHNLRIIKSTKNSNEDQRIPISNNISFNQPDHSFTITERTKNLNEEQISNVNVEQKNSKFEISIESSSSDSTISSRTELVAKVKSYFDNYFSSQTSNHSISEYETPTPTSPKSSEEFENINDITQVKSLTPSLNAQTSFRSNTNTTKQKEVKYKKGGLAYRLNALLKKQNANISLWQHERFLAANSNFIIPKEEFLAFRIKNIDFDFSIYSIEVVNKDNVAFLVIMNSVYANNYSFEINDILKIYKPYEIIKSNSYCNIIINVCKFECKKMN